MNIEKPCWRIPHHDLIILSTLSITVYTSGETQRDLKSQRGGMAMRKAAAMKGPRLIDCVPSQAKGLKR